MVSPGASCSAQRRRGWAINHEPPPAPPSCPPTCSASHSNDFWNLEVKICEKTVNVTAAAAYISPTVLTSTSETVVIHMPASNGTSVSLMFKLVDCLYMSHWRGGGALRRGIEAERPALLSTP